jgi:hypothetical protein
MAGRWIITEQQVQPLAIGSFSSTQYHPLGKVVRANYTGYASGSNNYGAGEFIYLKGVGSTVVGSLVTYDPLNGTTTLAPNTANLNNPLAVAMAASIASTYAWYQVTGVALIKKTAVAIAPGVAVYLSGTAGRIRGTVATGKQVVNARSVNAATVAAGTSTIAVLIQRPHAQGQII